MILSLDSISFDLNIMKIILALVMLGIATFLDVKKREVHDFLWIGFVGVAGILILLEHNNMDILFKTGLSIAIVVPITYVIWRLGFFAGADAFSLMVLSALAPFATLSDGQVTPFTTLSNAAVLSLIVILINASRNLFAIMNHVDIFEGFDESRTRKIVALFIGNRAKNPRYSFSIQKTVGNSKKFDFSLHHAEQAEFCKTPFTWVTPGLPFILYISGGFLVQVFFGDILFTILEGLHIF